MPTDIPDDPRLEALTGIEKTMTEEVVLRTDRLNTAVDALAQVGIAQQVLQIVADHPTATTIELVDWEKEALDGELFDVALAEVIDADDEVLTDAEEEYGFGASPIRHHWVLDELRVEGDDPGRNIDVAKTVAWAETLLSDETDEEA